MISSLDNSNISNNHNANNEYNLTANNKNNSILINNLNGTGEKEKDKVFNTINDFYSNLNKNNDISNQNEKNFLKP